MAVINETLAGTTPSAEVNPVNSISDVSVDGQGVIVQAKAPGGEWHKVAQQSGVFSLSTPSTSVLYRFLGLHDGVSAHVYFGD